MYKILEHIEKLSIEELEKEEKRTKEIRHKMIYEMRLLEEQIRKLGAIENLLFDVVWEKKEGLGESKTKKEKDALSKIKKYDDMTFDELKAELVERGLLK